jgi:phenylalanyl-tRNA synthetase beta chain
VRPAKASEEFTTLDEKEFTLNPENLVIADTAGSVALAGVMGAENSKVDENTHNILLESANFDFVSIRRTSRQFDLPSEASMRFSKGIHPEMVKPAAERAAELMRQYAGATICQGLVDSYPAPLPGQTITLTMAEVRRQLGTDMAIAEATRILRGLEFTVEEAGADALRVTPPAHRIDIQAGAADLIEELARVEGYDRLPATMLADELPEQTANVSLDFEQHVRDILVNCGLQEVITYALTEPERDAPVGLGQGEYVRLKNPISSERIVMRHSVLGGVLQVALNNLKNTDDVRLFEVGSAYLLKPGQKLPDEPRRVALFLAGRRQGEFWAEGAGTKPAPLDFFDIKGVVEALLADLHLSTATFRKPADGAYPYLHPGQSAEVLSGAQVIGTFGRLHPRYADNLGFGATPALAAELDLDALRSAVPPRFAYRPVPQHPPVLQDVAAIVPEDVPAERVAAEITAAGGNLLQAVRLFDVYRGDGIPPGHKSLAYSLTYQAADRTLTDKEVQKAHSAIEDRLRKSLRATIRGKD